MRKGSFVFFAVMALLLSYSCKKTNGFVLNTCGIDSANNFVDTSKISKLWVPNAFTPNGDHLNDCFHPVGLCINVNEPFLFEIYSGRKTIFSTHSIYESWNGADSKGKCPGAGKFRYRIIATGNDNYQFDLKGEVTLLLRDKDGNCVGASDMSKLSFGDMIDPHDGFVLSIGAPNPTSEITCK